MNIVFLRFSSAALPALEYLRASPLSVLLLLYLAMLSSHSFICLLILTDDLLNSSYLGADPNSESLGVLLRLVIKLALSLRSVLVKFVIFLRKASCFTFVPNLFYFFSASIFYFLASNLTRCFALIPSRSRMCKDFVFFPWYCPSSFLNSPR